MTVPLRILHLEDSLEDAELVIAALANEAISCCAERVETKADFEIALSERPFDLVLSDFALPSFDGLSALRISRDRRPDTPFIFVSGTLGEERAIETLKAGATDYVLKNRLSRLAPAVRRAIVETSERTARQQAERSRAEAESLLRALFEQVAVGIAIASLDGRIVQSNLMLTRMLGYSEPELHGLTLDKMTYPADRQIGSALLQELVEQRRTSFDVEKRLVRNDGSTLLTRVVSSLIEAPSGAPGFVVNLVEDVGERKEFECRLRQAQNMETVGRLAAGAAHDFNNFLTIINGYSDLLLPRVLEDSMRAMLQQIRGAGERARTLCARLLAFSRRQVPRPEYLDLNAIVGELQPMLSQLAAGRVQLTVKRTPDPAPIHADRLEVEQAIVNLVSNARDAMPDGGEITIQTEHVEVGQHSRPEREPGPYVVLDVADNGRGMDDDVKSRIFQPFFTTKEVGKGTGLGLWMVSETVQHSHGFLEVQSVQGQGTRFRIYLPRKAHENVKGLVALGRSVGDPVDTPAQSGMVRSQTTVVIADDDPAIRDFLEGILIESGYYVLTASNGRQALEILRTEKSSLLVTDLVMPDQEGIETIMAVKKEFPDLRIVAMSGSHGTPYLSVAKQMGAHAILKKPFDRAAVLAAINHALATPAGTPRQREVGASAE